MLQFQEAERRCTRAGLLAIAFAVMCAALAGCGPMIAPPGAAPVDRVGDAYEIKIERRTKTIGEGGSESSSFDRNTAIEYVVAVRRDGVDIEFDAPPGATEDDRLRDWQFPVRVHYVAGQPLELQNEADVQKRLDAYLLALLGGNSRTACGQWFFTWTAIKIECDPKSALAVAEMFLLRPADLREGAIYGETGALGTAPLRPDGTNAGALVAKLEIDGEAMRRQRAEADVVLAQMMAKPAIKMEEALRARASLRISGTLTITFETDSEGRVTRRTRVMDSTTVDASGSTEHTTTTETTDRRRIP